MEAAGASYELQGGEREGRGSYLVADSRRVRRPTQVLERATPQEALLDGALAALRSERAYRRRTREVLRLQRALRRRVDALGWNAYLDLEEAEVARWSHAMERVTRWAFARGRREKRRKRS